MIVHLPAATPNKERFSCQGDQISLHSSDSLVSRGGRGLTARAPWDGGSSSAVPVGVQRGYGSGSRVLLLSLIYREGHRDETRLGMRPGIPKHGLKKRKDGSLKKESMYYSEDSPDI